MGDAPREITINMLLLMRFCHIWHKTALVTYRGPHGIIFGPHPQSFRKEMNNIFITFLCTFSKSIC